MRCSRHLQETNLILSDVEVSSDLTTAGKMSSTVLPPWQLIKFQLLRKACEMQLKAEEKAIILSHYCLLCFTPVLLTSCSDQPFKLHLEASLVGAGAVLLQADKRGR